MARRDPVDGLLVPDPRFFDLDNLQANTAAGLTSDYTQAGPQPGSAVPQQAYTKMAPIISQAQEVAVRAQVINAGLPHRQKGVGLRYRLESEADTAYRMWSPPNWPQTWSVVDYTTSGTTRSYDAAVDPITGQIVVAAHDGGVYVGDPVDWSWSAATDPGLGTSTRCIVDLPDGRLLLLTFGADGYVGWTTDDAGTTWDDYSNDWASARGGGTSTAAGARARAARKGNDILMCSRVTASATILQRASSDLGTTFQDVETTGAVTVNSAWAAPSVVATDNYFLVAYLENAAAKGVVVRLTSPWDPISTATEIEITAGLNVQETPELAVDPDGVVWAFMRNVAQEIRVAVSYDEGATWTAMEIGCYDDGVAGDYLTNLKAVSAAGYIVLLHQAVASTSNLDNSVFAFHLAGWSNVSSGGLAIPTVPPDTDYQYRLGYGPDNSGAANIQATWLSYELPNNNGWTLVGTAPTLTTGAESRWNLAAASGYVYRAIGAKLDGAFQFHMKCAAGSGTLAANTIAARVTTDNGAANGYDVIIRLADTGFRVWDQALGAAVGADATVSTTNGIQIMIVLNGNNLWVAYRTPGSGDWTLHTDNASLTNTGGGGTPRFSWGHTVVGTAESWWRWCGFMMDGYPCIAEASGVLADIYLSRHHSGPIGLPNANAGGGEPIAYLSVQGGPGTMGDEWVINPRYDYALTNLFAATSPSPAQVWRSVGISTNVIIAWDLGQATYLGEEVAVVLLNTNVSFFTLEYWNGGAWIALTTVSSLVFGGVVTYALTGDAMTPPAGAGTDGTRYLHDNDLAGGWTSLATVKFRRILSNTAGWWINGTTSTARPVAILDGIDGTENAASTAQVYAPSLVAFLEPGATNVYARYWRIKIAQNLAQPEGYYFGGHLGIYRVQPFGAESSWGGAQETIPNTTDSRSRFGTSYSVEDGPPMTVWKLQESDGENHYAYRAYSDVDYLGHSSSEPMIAVEDTAYLMRGVLERTKGGEYPVVAVTSIPADGTTLTDRSSFLYGRLRGSVRINNVSGAFGEDEVVRVEMPRVEEIV